MRSGKWPSYIPTSLPSFTDISIWVTTPMPQAFVSAHAVDDSLDSPENLLSWISHRPFEDPEDGLALSGSGGVTFAVFVLLRVLITSRYLVDNPSIFGFSVDPAKAIQRIRPIIRVCVCILLADLYLSITRVQRNNDLEIHANFIPYPQLLVQNTWVDGSSSEGVLEQAQEKATSHSEKSKAKKTDKGKGVGLPKRNNTRNPPKKRLEATSRDAKVAPSYDLKRTRQVSYLVDLSSWDSIDQAGTLMVPPWHVFFEEMFAKTGKPLPEPLRVVIEKNNVSNRASNYLNLVI